ncbi:MAG: hypothetical protein WD205_06990, partial [Rhodothermales bacterium]
SGALLASELVVMLSVKHQSQAIGKWTSIISFHDKGSENVFDGEDTKLARKTLPSQLHGKSGKVLDRLNSAVSLQSLSLPGLRLEKLKGNRKGQHSI